MHVRPDLVALHSTALVRLSLLTAAAIVVAACSSGTSQAKAQDKQPVDNATPLTPSAANAELSAVMLAVAHAAVPSGGAPAVQDPKANACGGTVDATVNKVTTSMELESSPAEAGRTAVQMRDAGLAYLKAADWKVSAPEDHGDEHLGFAIKHGLQLRISASDTDKTISVLGNTPCLDDVQATPAG